MRMRSAVVLALMLALTACGGDAEPKTDASKAAAKKAAMDGALPNVADGRSMPEALSDFVCARDDKGAWKASGAVTNRSKEPVSFQVTVHVGTADAATKVLRRLERNLHHVIRLHIAAKLERRLS